MFSEPSSETITAVNSLPDVSETTLAVLVLGSLVIGLLLEALTGREKAYMKLRGWSYLVNIGTFLSNNIIMSLLSMSTLLFIAERYSNFGLLSAVDNPVTKFLLAFVLLDLTLYVWHRACHSFDCLWVFHKVHHSDQSMNVSTSFRLHISEVVLTTAIKALLIAAVGVHVAIIIICEVIITLFILFHHWDLNVPGQQWLSRFIITPSLHRVHHSELRAEHDSNYGAALSIWDRIFGTRKECRPAAIGLKGVGRQSWLTLLKYGFTPEPSTVVVVPQWMPLGA